MPKTEQLSGCDEQVIGSGIVNDFPALTDSIMADLQTPTAPPSPSDIALVLQNLADMPEAFFDDWNGVTIPQGPTAPPAPPPPSSPTVAAPSVVPFPRMTTRSSTSTLVPRDSSGRFQKIEKNANKNNLHNN